VIIGNCQENNRVVRCGRIGKSPNPRKEETRPVDASEDWFVHFVSETGQKTSSPPSLPSPHLLGTPPSSSKSVPQL